MTPRTPASRAVSATLATLGWVAGQEGPQRSSVEMVGNSSWSVGRVWTSAGSLTASPSERQVTRILIGVDGTGTLQFGSDAVELGARQMILLPGDKRFSTANGGIWARCEWKLRSPAIRQDRFSSHFSQVIALPPESYTLITTMTNVVSTSQSIQSGPGAPLLLEALAGVIMAALMDTTGQSAGLTPNQAAIMQRATEVIEVRHTSPDFDVTSLAEELHLSVRHLRRVYANAEQTPRGAIELRRVMTAQSVLSVNPGWYRKAKEEVARAAGFSSIEQMEAAFRRHRIRPGTPAPAVPQPVR